MQTLMLFAAFVNLSSPGLSGCWGLGGYIGIMEKKMETTVTCWGYIGIMEKKMEPTRSVPAQHQTLVLGLCFACRLQPCGIRH